MFWPQEWLPNEVGFKHVRLHSYGYNSDYSTRKESPLTIHDFGQGFLVYLYNSPYLRKNGDVSPPQCLNPCPDATADENPESDRARGS